MPTTENTSIALSVQQLYLKMHRPSGNTTHSYTLFHLASEYSTGVTIPDIPGDSLVKMFISKVEERGLGIPDYATSD